MPRWFSKKSPAPLGPGRPVEQSPLVRGVSAGDLAPVPEGFRVGPPDFVGIGTGSAGTSWWYSLLLDHPAIVENRVGRKELQFFYAAAREGLTDEQRKLYREAFARPEGAICGEWSPGILGFPLVVPMLAEVAPDAKLLVLLRNPIDRYASAIHRLLTRRRRMMGVEGARDVLYSVHSLFPEAIQKSLYADDLARVLALFPRERLLVLQYEACERDPAAELAKTYAYLGIDPAHRPAQLEQRVNPGDPTREPLDAAARARLADWFAPDVERVLASFPELDPKLWVDFAH